MSKKKNNKVKKRKGESYMDALSMGPSRAPKFKEAMEEYAREICRLVFVDGKTDDELVHSMGKIDEGLLKIVGKENFVAHDIRYGRRIN